MSRDLCVMFGSDMGVLNPCASLGQGIGFWVLIKMHSETCSVLLLDSLLLSLNYSELADVKSVLGFINQRYCVKCCKSRIYKCGLQ